MIRILQAISRALLKLEFGALIVLAASVTGLILLNVITRAFDMAIFWVDELAIYTMIWMVMIGASVKIRLRRGIAVTLLEDRLGDRIGRALKTVVDAIVLAFALTLIWLSWIWYDPLTLASHDFDPQAFSGATFNFIYQEPTNTLGVPKYLIWLIMPVSAAAMSLHAAVNLVERLAGVEPAVPETE